MHPEAVPPGMHPEAVPPGMHPEAVPPGMHPEAVPILLCCDGKSVSAFFTFECLSRGDQGYAWQYAIAIKK